MRPQPGHAIAALQKKLRPQLVQNEPMIYGNARVSTDGQSVGAESLTQKFEWPDCRQQRTALEPTLRFTAQAPL
jgi:hypothetical protein